MEETLVNTSFFLIIMLHTTVGISGLSLFFPAKLFSEQLAYVMVLASNEILSLMSLINVVKYVKYVINTNY